MNRQYTIGEMAAIMGISVQTLRLYSDMGLIAPCYINPETGYRYYDSTAFSPIDRLKYLQQLGFSLAEIKDLYEKDSVSAVAQRLKQLEAQTLEEIQDKQALLENIRWYHRFFTQTQNGPAPKTPYIKYFPERAAFLVDRTHANSKEQINEQLYLHKNKAPYKQLSYRRQFVTLYQTEAFFSDKLRPFRYGIYLNAPNHPADLHIQKFPAGYYICFFSQILLGDWSCQIFRHFFKDHPLPPFIIADEYENSLFRFDQCSYEVQLFFQPAVLEQT
jgi:DNA-binding transcriptional MerR regulator